MTAVRRRATPELFAPEFLGGGFCKGLSQRMPYGFAANKARGESVNRLNAKAHNYFPATTNCKPPKRRSRR